MHNFLEAIAILPWWYWTAFIATIGVLFAWVTEMFVVTFSFHSKKLKRVAQVVTGFGMLTALSWIFDNIAYPAVIAWRIVVSGEAQGLIEGGVIMSLIAIAITAILLVMYQRSSVDWMGMDALAAVRENGDEWARKFEGKMHKNVFVRTLFQIVSFVPLLIFRGVVWMLNKGDFLAFIALSLTSDGFLTTAYLRHGYKGPLRKKDWMIFLASSVLTNVYWVLRSYGVVVIVRYFWNMFA